jgi:ABC-type polysaccharide/polyol phosphate transport system ATPase subunit
VSSPAIQLAGVGKRYRLTADDAMLVKRLTTTLRGERGRELWALRDLDLTVEEGETIGVIGRNGAGKTTLLQLLAGVTAPTAGVLRVHGSIAPLIGIGVGFNPELTGRENVFANGEILGIPRSVLVRDFDEIVAFAELEEFIETPVKYYSSGMFLRLAFAVAIHVEPDVLLVDEVLAVGDLAFQLKCFERMRALQARGTTIVIVTHNLGILERLASRTVVLRKGRISFVGPVEQALDHFHEISHADAAAANAKAPDLTQQEGNEMLFAGGADVALSVAVDADEVVVDVEATFDVEVRDPILGLMASQLGGGPVYMLHTLPGEYAGEHGPGRPLRARLRLQNALLAGRYALMVQLSNEGGKAAVGRARATFTVERPWGATGVVDLGAAITVEGAPVPLAGSAPSPAAPAPVGRRRTRRRTAAS